jgi:glycosyltransferase involved in cell wall biosynthesis
MTLPALTVVMSVRNGERTVRQAVESILGQTLRDLALVVVEDGSTDDTWALLQEAASRDGRLILLRNEANVGLTRSLNRGLSHASGEFVARQDAEDFMEPQRDVPPSVSPPATAVQVPSTTSQQRLESTAIGMAIP